MGRANISTDVGTVFITLHLIHPVMNRRVVRLFSLYCIFRISFSRKLSYSVVFRLVNSSKEKPNMIPGGEMAARPLHFFWIADCSGSMAGDKIQSLNTAIREAIPEMRRVAANNPNAQVLVRAIKFSS